ncbi:MAG TPA: hypothetical protein VGV85_13245, partial [Longimicrobiaceae bacterium]|nr:hypothetical protein [Longimicrobiaceae bacterium]
RTLPLLAAILAAAACEAPPTDLGSGKADVVVHGILHAGSDTAAVLLTSAPYARVDWNANLGLDRLRGAQVRILDGARTVPLPEAPAGFPDCLREPEMELNGRVPPAREGCYTARLPAAIRSGARYELRVELPGGRSLTGAATVPEPPTILAPAERARVPARGRLDADSSFVPDSLLVGIARIPVRWRQVPGMGYDVNLQVAAAFRNGARLRDVRCLTDPAHGFNPRALRADSLLFVLQYVNCYAPGVRRPWDSVHVRVRVTAYDSVYARHVQEVFNRQSVRFDRAAAGVEGGLGVFAAAATAEREITLVAGN